jgi:glucose-1-phosphate adenylyltransferase
MLEKTIGIILAGGIGSRLHPLTADRAKPAVPFGGRYRIIDFTLSNCLHSGLRRILVLTQYMSGFIDGVRHSLGGVVQDGKRIYGICLSPPGLREGMHPRQSACANVDIEPMKKAENFKSRG